MLKNTPACSYFRFLCLTSLTAACAKIKQVLLYQMSQRLIDWLIDSHRSHAPVEAVRSHRKRPLWRIPAGVQEEEKHSACWFQTQLNTQAVFRQRPSNCSCNNHFYINYNHSHENRFPSNVNGCDWTQLSSPFHWRNVKKTPSVRRPHRTSSGAVESLPQKL